jgi:flagellar motor switch protein FliM
MTEKKKQPTSADTAQLTRHIKEAAVDVQAILGTTVLKIQDLIALDVGDVIPLNRRINEPLILKVGEMPKFYVQPGKFKNKLAVQVMDIYEEGIETDEPQ